MPFFFLLSGLFLVRQASLPAAELGRRKLATIVYPYFVWSVILLALQGALGRYTNGTNDPWKMWTIIYAPPLLMWFLYSLLIVQLIFVCLRKLGASPLAILLLFLGWKISAVLWWASAWVPLNGAQQNGVWTALGAAFVASPRAIRVAEHLSTWVLTFIAAAGYLVVGWIAWHHRDPVFLLPFVAPLCGIIASAALAGCLARMPQFAFLEDWGRRVLKIYLAHTLSVALARITLLRLLGIDDVLVHLVAGTIAGIYLPLVLSRLASRLNFELLFRLPMPRNAG